MKEFFELTDRFAKQIEEIEKQRMKVGKILRELKEEKIEFGEDVFGKKLITPVEKSSLEELRIAGIDGGMVKQSFHGIDIILLKAVGVIFNFKKGKLQEVQYQPDSIPFPIPNIIHDPFSDLDFELNANMQRQMIEVETAIETIKKFKPEILLLDGSIVPHYVHKPEQSSPLFQIYQKMVESYRKLFMTAIENKTILAGVIEDSRGTRLCEILNQNLFSIPEIREARVLLEKTKDTNLLAYALNYGEMTFAFMYSPKPEEHPILREFGDMAKQVHSFYLKTAEFDRPVRVDFLASSNVEDIANKISSVLLAICNSSTYGFPSVLIEADLRARMSEKEIEEFGQDLRSRLVNLAGMFDLRRKGRPF